MSHVHSLSQSGGERAFKAPSFSWAHWRMIGQPSLTVGGANKQQLQMARVAPGREAVRENAIFSPSKPLMWEEHDISEQAPLRSPYFDWMDPFRACAGLGRAARVRPGPDHVLPVLSVNNKWRVGRGGPARCVLYAHCKRSSALLACSGGLSRVVAPFVPPQPARGGQKLTGRMRKFSSEEELQSSRSAGRTNFKMPGKKVCVVGSGNW